MSDFTTRMEAQALSTPQLSRLAMGPVYDAVSEVGTEQGLG